MDRWTIIVLVAVLGLAAGQGTICSAFCATSGCSDWTSDGCNGKCYTGWTWDSVDTVCDFTPVDQKTIMTYSYDAGGDLDVSPDPNTLTCTFTGSGAGTYYFGDYKASDTVTLTLAIGTYLPHYAFDLLFNIILQDVNGINKWQTSANGPGQNPKMKATLTSSTPTQNLSVSMANSGAGSGSQSVASGSVIASSNGACGSGSKADNYERLIYSSFTHNDTGNPITITLTTDNDNGNALWDAREFILVAYTCNVYCLSCFNKQITQCYSCDISQGYMLSGTTCNTSCLTGYGPTTDPAVCILCDLKCTACYDLADNCTTCKSTGANASYLYDNTTIGYSQCVLTCPAGTFINSTARTCDLCDANCTTCAINSTYCYSCVVGYGWAYYNCFMPCPDGRFFENTNCSKCPNTCAICSSLTVCSVCTLSGVNKAYLLNSTCYTNCPSGYYNDDSGGTGPNFCTPCVAACATCTDNPSPCQSCNLNYYLYSNDCQTTCPSGYIAYDPLRQCLDCDLYCVDLTISFSFSDALHNILYIDMQFTRDLNFSTFDMTSFQTVSISNQQLANYNVAYEVTSTSSYRISLEPKGYVFLYNETVTVLTKDPPSPYEESLDGLPFKTSTYQKTGSKSWFLMRSPAMTDSEQAVINGLSSINNVLVTTTTTPFVAEVKKSGVMSLLFGGAQITSCSILINQIHPQNMYEGVRFWGVSVFYDVPQWELTSDIPNNVFGKELYALTQNERRLFNLNSLYWRFQRTGMTTFFIYDVYIPLLLLTFTWVLILIAKLLQRYRGTSFKKW
jgi:hypothetical protein